MCPVHRRQPCCENSSASGLAIIVLVIDCDPSERGAFPSAIEDRMPASRLKLSLHIGNRIGPDCPPNALATDSYTVHDGNDGATAS
jgi:hypothetical protein